MAQWGTMDRYHFKLALSRELWQELLKAALPIRLVDGELDLAHNARTALRQLSVKERVAGFLEDRQPPTALLKVRDRARAVWVERKPSVFRRLNQILRVDGTWRVEVDSLGTDLTYGHQRVGADAYLKGTAEGTVFFFKENIEIPFVIEKRVGASVAIGDVHYDKDRQAVIGSLQDLAVHLGDGAVLQLIGRLAEYGLDKQLDRVNPLPILQRAQVEEMVKPMGGPLKMNMGVDDLMLEITGDDMTLKVRFGFSQAQLTDRELEAEGP